MKITPLEIPELLLIEYDVFTDNRGDFRETYNSQKMFDAGITKQFVQDNVSVSNTGVFRGFHYQLPHAQAKLVTCLRGVIRDYIVDIRRSSPTFGKWVSYIVREGMNSIYIPEGFAHGFLAINQAVVHYKVTDFWHPDCEHTLLWSDESLGETGLYEPTVSDKDKMGFLLKDLTDIFD